MSEQSKNLENIFNDGDILLLNIQDEKGNNYNLVGFYREKDDQTKDYFKLKIGEILHNFDIISNSLYHQGFNIKRTNVKDYLILKPAGKQFPKPSEESNQK